MRIQNQVQSIDHAFPYDLSIAMIFRNDIRSIRQCLETMKPLRKLLRLQLIMTDTGSTDGSRAIAQEYADILLDFSWCDDFSAARNTGVAKAQGRWFAYFDCDHEFDQTISHLADFVTNPDNHQIHQSAHLTLIDYIKKGNSIFTEKQERPYLVNFSHGKKEFKQPILESIPLPPSTITLPMNIFRWGYYENLPLKRARTIPILEKIIKNHPNELKYYLQLVSEVDTDSQRISLLQQGLKASEKDPRQQPTRLVASVTLLGCALREQEETLFQETKTLLQSEKLPLGIQLEFYGLLTTYALEKAQCDDAYILFQEFQRLYKQNEKTPDSNTFSQGFFLYKHPSNFYDLECKLLATFQKHQRNAEAIALLRRSQSYLFQIEDAKPFFIPVFQFAFALRDFTTLQRYYLYLLEEKKVALLLLSQDFLEEETPKLQQEEREDFQNLFTLEIQDAYTALWKLRQNDFQLEECPPKVKDFLSQSPLLHPITIYSDLLQHYFQTGMDHFRFLHHNPMAQLLIASAHLLEKYPHYHGFIHQKLEHFQKDKDSFLQLPLKEQGFWANIGFLSLQGESQQEDSGTVLPHFRTVAKIMVLYLQQIYLPQLLSHHNNTILCPEEALACIAHKAQSKPDDVLSYIKSLKEILQISPPYKALILLLIQEAKEQFQQTTKVPTRSTPPKIKIPVTKPQKSTSVPIQQGTAEAETSPEVTMLRGKVKEAITQLLTHGKKEQAKIALERYKTLHPTDPEIPLLEAQWKT